MHDIHVWGDSHWRIFFPFVNHGSPGVTHEHEGIRTIDMVANELSGATMWGLLNDNSKNGARRRILGDLDRIGPVENVALTFGEVDVRYHNGRYFCDDLLSYGRVLELLSRYRRFIDEDLLWSGRVTSRVFPYFGYMYPKGEETLLQPGVTIGPRVDHATALEHLIRKEFWERLRSLNVRPITFMMLENQVSDDGVHLVPQLMYPRIHKELRRNL